MWISTETVEGVVQSAASIAWRQRLNEIAPDLNVPAVGLDGQPFS